MEKELRAISTQVLEAYELVKDNVHFKAVEGVFIGGMGGSALPGDFVKSLFYPLPFELHINKDYEIPEFVNKKWLSFIISYSGNTEETISMYKECKKRTNKIVVITSGGRLEKMAKRDKVVLIKVPKGLQPRMAVFYMSIPIVKILKNSSIVKINLNTAIKKASSVAKEEIEKEAESIAKKIKNKIVVIYSSTRNFILSEKWKISINENSKAPAFFNHFPEWNHNEINGFKNKGNNKIVAIMLKDKKDNVRIRKRFEITKNILLKQKIDVIEVDISKANRLATLVYGIMFGDWVSYELSKLYNQDPYKVPIIEELKEELRNG